ncbi:MAG TPA: hypothetical protein VIG99_24600 [Myxococcaceae bacterium]|jgi:hypothetical protein
MGPAWLLVALAVSADHGFANVSIQAEAHGSASLQGGGAAPGLGPGLSVQPNLDLGLLSGTLRADIGYHPQFTLTNLAPAFLHRIQASAEWRLSPGRRVQVDQQLSFGQYDTSLGNLGQGGLFPDYILPLGIVDYLTSDTAVGLDGAIIPRLRLRAGAGYHVSGGLTAEAQAGIPLQQGPRLSLELQHDATRRDSFSGHAKLSADRFSNGKNAGVAEGGGTWHSILTRELALSVGAGVAAAASAPAGEALVPLVVPVATVGLTFGVPRIRFSLDAGYAPQADALSGNIYRRAGLNASGEYHPRSDLTARAGASGSFSLGAQGSGDDGAVQTGDRSVQGEASLAFHEGGLEVSGGLRVADVLLSGSHSTEVRAFVAFSLKGPVR